MRTMMLALLLLAFGAAGVADADDVTIDDAAFDGVTVTTEWQALADLTELLPDNIDDETRQLIVDLLAESGGFASVQGDPSGRAGRPANELEPEPPPRIRLSILSRAEGVLEHPPQRPPNTGEPGTGGWRSFDSRTYLRLRGDIAGGVTFGGAVERDPGEREALDHLGGYLRWDGGESGDAADDGGCTTVIAGDVVVEWGQRLVAGAPGFGAPGGPVLTDRLRGYDGAAESVGRRGVAAATEVGSYAVVALATRTLLDAGLDDEGRATTIRSSGTHVTVSEREGKDALCESVLGARLARSFGGTPSDSGWRACVSALRVRYDRTLTSADLLRSRYGFEGDAITLYGIDVSGISDDLRWGAEVAAHAPQEHAVLITIEGRRGRTRVLVGADLVSRGFYSPLGAAPPGSSSGANCASTWLRLSYSTRRRWSAWCRGHVTAHPWRTYSEPLPPRAGSLAAGVRARVGRTARIAAEVCLRDVTATSAAPYSTESTADRRERISLDVGNDRKWRLWFARTARTRDGDGVGRRIGIGCSLASVLNASRDRLDAGVMFVSGEGSAPTLYAGEPGLPGAFGLRSLKGPGAGWYIRVRRALPAGTLLTVRLSRSASGEQLTLGLAIEAGTTGRR